jgi:hypothetical protein
VGSGYPEKLVGDYRADEQAYVKSGMATKRKIRLVSAQGPQSRRGHRSLS